MRLRLRQRTRRSGPRSPRRRRSRRERIALGLLATAVVAVAALVAAVLGPGDAVVVLRSGELNPSAGPVEELLIFDRFTVFVDPEFRESRGSGDIVSVLLLVALAGVCGTGHLLARRLREGIDPRLSTFLGVASLGAAWLALDELIGLHETIGANLPFSVPGGGHNDDAVIGLYALTGILFVTRFRALLASSRRALTALAFGLTLTVAAASIDAITPSGAEELVEIAAAAALLLGFTLLVVDHLVGAFGRAGTEDSASQVRASEAFARRSS